MQPARRSCSTARRPWARLYSCRAICRPTLAIRSPTNLISEVADAARLAQRLFSKGQIHGHVDAAVRTTSLGWTDLRTEVVTALPFFTRENPIIITPSYELHFLKRRQAFRCRRDCTTRSSTFTSFACSTITGLPISPCQPGLYADDYSFDSSEALRINGRALGVYAPTIDVKWVLGVTYLDGGGWAKVVPVAGVIYTPTDDVEYQLAVPHAARRVAAGQLGNPWPRRTLGLRAGRIRQFGLGVRARRRHAGCARLSRFPPDLRLGAQSRRRHLHAARSRLRLQPRHQSRQPRATTTSAWIPRCSCGPAFRISVALLAPRATALSQSERATLPPVANRRAGWPELGSPTSHFPPGPLTMSTRIRATVLAVLVSLFAPAIVRADEAIEIFNGKDFKGWTKRGGEATYASRTARSSAERAEHVEHVLVHRRRSTATSSSNSTSKLPTERLQLRRPDPQPSSARRTRQGARLRLPGRDRHRARSAPGPPGIYFEGGMLDEEATKAGQAVWIRKGGWLNDLSKNEAAQKGIASSVNGTTSKSWPRAGTFKPGSTACRPPTSPTRTRKVRPKGLDRTPSSWRRRRNRHERNPLEEYQAHREL